jgi:hypothetical protein
MIYTCLTLQPTHARRAPVRSVCIYTWLTPLLLSACSASWFTPASSLHCSQRTRHTHILFLQRTTSAPPPPTRSSQQRARRSAARADVRPHPLALRRRRGPGAVLLAFRCRRVAECAPQLVHSVERGALDPGLLLLVEDQVRPEAARQREFREAAPDRALLDVLEAVVRRPYSSASTTNTSEWSSLSPYVSSTNTSEWSSLSPYVSSSRVCAADSRGSIR